MVDKSRANLEKLENFVLILKKRKSLLLCESYFFEPFADFSLFR
jgi:hypothetical protein